jgi:parallel beta-helix repeat protein
MDKKYGMLIVSVTILVLSFVGTASASTWYVDDDGGTEFMRIQDAIDNATAGDTIIVKDGTYIENVDVYVENLTIKSGNGSVSTIVRASNPDDHVFSLRADSITLSGFTITGTNRSSTIHRVGISLYRVNNCTVISNNVSFNNLGIRLMASNNTTIAKNTINSNANAGILLIEFSSAITISSNTINSNGKRGINLLRANNCILINNTAHSNNYDGIYLWKSGNNSLTNNTVDSYFQGSGICLWGSNKNTLTNNTLLNNQKGLSLDDHSSNNELTSNNALDNDNGFFLSDSSNNLIYLNNFINNTRNAYSYNSTNIWNTTEQITYTFNCSNYTNYLGNYWGDYRGTDAEGDGIGDTPYSIYSESDDYPLMDPFENYVLTTSAPA